MSEFVAPQRMTGEPDRQVYEDLERERPRLRNWIRRRLADPSEVEDVLQDVFFELGEAPLRLARQRSRRGLAKGVKEQLGWSFIHITEFRDFSQFGKLRNSTG